MSDEMVTIRSLGPSDQADCLAGLTTLLLDAVSRGASLGFMASLDAAQAQAYWQGVFGGLGSSGPQLWVASVAGQLVGTVQLDPCPRANGRNRAEVCKLMVDGAFRGRGIASLLMATLEGAARRQERGLLYLDTEAGSGAEGLYHTLGYTRLGEIPDYACSPGGQLGATAYYYKQLIDRSLTPLAADAPA